MVAEQALLGSILIDPEAIKEVADSVNYGDFYISEHREIFAAMHRLFVLSSDIDIVTLIDELVKNGVYDKSGGEQYLKTLTASVPSAVNITDYAKIVKEKSIIRQLIEASSEISDKAYAELGSADEILEFANSKIFSISQGRDTKNFAPIDKVIYSVLDHLRDLHDNPEAFAGTQTGFSELDGLLAGMGDSDLVLIGARPGMGKTSFALNIATNVAEKTKKKVAIFSLEMSNEQLVTRILSSRARVDSYSLRTGEMSDEEFERIAYAASDLSACPILLDDTAGITVTGMKAKLRREGNVGLIVIDYLQLLQSDNHTDNRVQEVAEITRSMKLMAKELMVPIICCAQLSRGPEARQSKKPMLSDLRDSGSIEQDADSVIFLYRDEYYKVDEKSGGDDGGDAGSIAECIVAKNRHGSTGTVKLYWNGRFTTFSSISQRSE